MTDWERGALSLEVCDAIDTIRETFQQLLRCAAIYASLQARRRRANALRRSREEAALSEQIHRVASNARNMCTLICIGITQYLRLDADLETEEMRAISLS